MRRVALAVLVMVGFAFVHGGSHVPPPRPAVEEDIPIAPSLAVADAPQTIEELRLRLELILQREQIAGAAIAIVGRDGPIWVEGLGVRDRETGAAMTADTVFRVGSLSKSIVALGVMRLVDQGKLDLDRPLREYMPELQIDNPWEGEAPVTLAQCLEHTAGLDDMRFNELFADENISAKDALAINNNSKKLRWRPGTRHGYSNVGYTIAGRAIEIASGEPFDTYIRREILAPMGITRADFKRTDAMQLATGYMDGTAMPLRTFAHRPAGALLASANDLAKIVHFWIARGEGYPPIVSRAGLERIERSGTLPYPHLDAEYGFANYGDVQHPVIGRGHDGGMPGFHASFRYFPSIDVGYAVLINSNYTFRGYFEIRALLFAYLTRGKTFPPPPVAPEPVRPTANYYTSAASSNELFGFINRVNNGWKIRDEGGRVLARHFLEGQSFWLVPTADGAYRAPRESGSSIQFTTNADGTQAMHYWFSYAEAVPGWLAELRYGAAWLGLMLLRLIPLWSVTMLVIGVYRRVVPTSLALWPAVCGLSFFALPLVANAAFFYGVIGIVHPLTVAIFAITLLFALGSIMTLVSTVRWARRPDRPSVAALLLPMICGLAFTGLTIWLAANGWIGIRTWSY